MVSPAWSVANLAVLKLWRLKHLKIAPWIEPPWTIAQSVLAWRKARNDLIGRLNARTCEACGDTDGPFEMHHLRALKDKQAEPLTVWKNRRDGAKQRFCAADAMSPSMPVESKQNGEPCALKGASTVRREALGCPH